MKTETPKLPRRVIRMAEVCNRLGRSRWSIRRLILAGKFPRPLPDGSFLESDVEAYIDALVGARDAEAA